MSKLQIALVSGMVIAFALIGGIAVAANGNDGIIEGNWPEGVDVWRVDGKIFTRVINADGSVFGVYYWCEGECDGLTCPIDPNYTPPAGNGNGGPDPTDAPPEPTDTPPKPTDAPQCDDDDCDEEEDDDNGEGDDD